MPALSYSTPSAELRAHYEEPAGIWDTHERLAFFVGQADATTSDGARVTD